MKIHVAFYFDTHKEILDVEMTKEQVEPSRIYCSHLFGGEMKNTSILLHPSTQTVACSIGCLQ